MNFKTNHKSGNEWNLITFGRSSLNTYWFSSSWILTQCCSSELRTRYDVSHKPHLYGRILVWILVCFFKSSASSNPLPQVEHPNRLIPKWMPVCLLSDRFVRNSMLHFWHLSWFCPVSVTAPLFLILTISNPKPSNKNFTDVSGGNFRYKKRENVVSFVPSEHSFRINLNVKRWL